MEGNLDIYFFIGILLVIVLLLYRLLLANKSLESYKSNIDFELSLAKRMQNNLMPAKKEWLKSDFVVKSCYKGLSEIGGDLWGAYNLPGEKTGFFILDCSGNGIYAALNVFRVHSVMCNNMRDASNPKKFLEAINKPLCDLLEKDGFVTMFYCVVDKAKNTLTYSGAASNPQFVMQNGKMNVLNFASYPLGVVEKPEYKNHKRVFKSKDIMFLHTDGILDMMKEESIEDKEQELIKILKADTTFLKNPNSKKKIEDILLKNNIDLSKVESDTTIVSIFNK